MIEISAHAELAARCHGDTLCLWVAQGLSGRSRAWRSPDGTALAVAGPDLSTRDRIAVHGRAEAAIPLVIGVLGVAGSTFRPLGERDLISAIVAGIPELAPAAEFGWMDSHRPASIRYGPGAAHWLPETEQPDVTALLKVSFPDSDAQPGAPGVERWAGARDEQGRLVAVTAVAWSAPDTGYLAGVAVHPEARGRGYGAHVCGFVLAEALAEHGAAALMVDQQNHSAIRLYLSLGMSYRALTAAYVNS